MKFTIGRGVLRHARMKSWYLGFSGLFSGMLSTRSNRYS